MAKRSRNKRKSKDNRRVQRDTYDITKRELLYPFFIDNYKRDRKRRDILSDIEDNRRWRPEYLRDNYKIDGKTAEIIEDAKRLPDSKTIAYAKMAYGDALRTVVCIRRRARRVAMFARGRIGFGKKVTRLRRYNDNSKIKC